MIVEGLVAEVLSVFRERYYIDIFNAGFDGDLVHLLFGFLPKYSGGQVVRLVTSITSQRLFRLFPSLEQELWGGEFWTHGYYISTIGGRGDKKVIERYIEN